jgi:predicted acyl esterase
MDQEILFLAWMDQYVKGKPMGLETLPKADVVVDAGTHRETDSWPTAGATNRLYSADFDNGHLAATGAGQGVLLLDQTGMLDQATAALGKSSITLTTKLTEPIGFTGQGHLWVRGTLDGAANGYLAAYLYEDRADGPHLITWGQVNLAHNEDHTKYTPITPTDVVGTTLPLRPTEHIFAANSTLRLVLRGVVAADATDPYGLGGARFTFQSGPGGTQLVLPTLPLTEFKPIPLTATP